MSAERGNALTGAEAVVRILQGYGVEVVFGLCGDTSLPLYDALARLDHGITHVLTRDERSAAYMADAYARLSGRVGVCEGPSGGGATYILPGVVEANESSVPLLAITSDISVSSRGRFTLTEIDQEALFRPATAWNAVIDRSADIPRTMRAAFSAMTEGRPGAAHIGLPFDVQRDAVDEEELGVEPDIVPRKAPDPDSVRDAAKAIASASAPLFVCGGGVMTAGAETALLNLAEKIGAPVATTVSGKGSIAETHELAVGVVGSNGGTPETRAVVEAADTVVFVGCRAGSVTTERWRFPRPGEARIVHIDIDARVLGANYPTEAAVEGDARLALEALGDALDGAAPGRIDPAFVAAQKRKKFAAFDALAKADAKPIRPERLVSELQAALPPDAVVVADPGTPCPYLSAYLVLEKPGRRFVSNRAHGALGYAMPAAVGAQFARPGAKCVAVMGDGSFAFAAGELETVVRLGLPITFVVVSNSSFGWIKAGQKTGYGGRYHAVDFSRSDHARIAEAYGVRSWSVVDPGDLAPALRAALAHDGPSLVDAVCQPLEEARAPVSEWVA
ncbi:MAG: thiamine pyrophosphate-binding protein [Defluviicoccus sp.]|nr:thiamine pyrophosphate-binding protein [Defluviicoccus sp.]MDE0277215.1 thiamine pyrophosphate-binding protein [Defluviicoccus sp.]